MWFLWSCVPGLYWKDAGELTTAGFVLGVPHPTGFPTYMLFAKLASMIPVGNVAFRVTMVSVICASVAVGACVYSVTKIAERLKPPTISSISVWIGAILSVGILLQSPTFDLISTTAEVYSPLAMAITLSLAVFVAWTHDPDAPYLRWFLYFIAAFGVGTHILATPILVLLVMMVVASISTAAKRRYLGLDARFLVAGAITAPLVYLYLPLTALADPFWNWGDPTTLDRFVAHVSGASIRMAFADSMGIHSWATTQMWLEQYWLQLWEGATWLIFFGIFGLYAVWRSNQKKFAAALVFIWAIDGAFSVWVNPMGIVDRQTAVPSIVVSTILSAYGGVWLYHVICIKAPKSALIRSICLTSLAILLALPTISAPDRPTRKNDQYADLVGHAILQQTAPGGRLFVASDDMSAALAYLTAVDGARPDVAVIFSSHVYDHNAVTRWGRLYKSQIPDRTLRLSQAARASNRWMYTEEQRQILASMADVPVAHSTGVWETGQPSFDSLWRTQLTPSFPLFSGTLSGLNPNLPSADAAAAPQSPYPLADTLDTVKRWSQWLHTPPTLESAHLIAECLRQGALWEAQQNRLQSASAILAASLNIAPDYDRSLANLGAVLDRMGDVAAAITATQRAVELRPWAAGPRVNLTRMFIRTGELTQATTLASETLALAQNPSDVANVHVELGKIALLSKSYDEAKFHTQQALEINQNHAGALELVRHLDTTSHQSPGH
ncbi:MAG: DUF2723 domain-containing protein [Myxococcales bacterium]|nr:DUF2723 domain-containing protein [Myxococcales bacterium]